ncbi:MAG: T9SS type A sorting domain-containing protein [Bacteroidota bacterium]|nr:T9SS type A sorting domain-containing protein [Bacteroidota bacterium]
MKTKFMIFLISFFIIFFNNLGYSQSSTFIPSDMIFKVENFGSSGNIYFSIKKVGTIYSGDVMKGLYCPAQKKIYSHEYQRKDDMVGCPNSSEPQSIIGVDHDIIWSEGDIPKTIYIDYIGAGGPRAPGFFDWIGYGIYEIKIKNKGLTIEKEYIFYIDFMDSNFPDDPGCDIIITYDNSKSINSRVYIRSGKITSLFEIENNKVYRVWNELQFIPKNQRNGDFFFPNILPLDGVTSDTLLSPAIVDINTNIIGPGDPELPNNEIIIDPYLYPEPSKLKDLKLTIADNITLTAQRKSALIIGNGAEISLGNNSVINIASGGNLFISANSIWSFGTNSQLTVNGNFKIKSKIPIGWNMLSVPNIVSNYDKSIVYPDAITPAYTYESGGYVPKSTLENGKGYWVKFNQGHTYEYEGPPILNHEINLVAGWNMIGSISLNLLKSKATSDPPGIISSYLYGYRNGAYHVADTIIPGLGYWVKANQSGILKLNINSTTSLNQPAFCADQPSANPPGASPIPKLVKPDSSATGISINPIFRWRKSTDAVSYRLQISTNNCFTNLIFDDPSITDTLKQVSLSYSTKYCWRVNASSDIATSNWSNTWVFTTQSAPQPPNPCDPVASLSTLDNFTITDANGNTQTMYTRNAGRAVNLGISDFEMPPVTPKGLFNVRFQSNKFIETVLPNQKIKRMPIVIKDAQYPININWNIKWQNNTKYWLTRPGSGEDKILLSSNGNLYIGSSQNDILFVEAQAALPRPCEFYKTFTEENIPENFTLYQNYPNPFNPTTVIKYDLPENGYVTLKIYDVLGKEVAKLVDGFQEAGYKSVEFDAINLTSGVYFYKLVVSSSNPLNASSYTSVKKMVLIR